MNLKYMYHKKMGERMAKFVFVIKEYTCFMFMDLF